MAAPKERIHEIAMPFITGPKIFDLENFLRMLDIQYFQKVDAFKLLRIDSFTALTKNC